MCGKQYLKNILAVCIFLSVNMNVLAEGDVISFQGKDPTPEDLINAFTGGKKNDMPDVAPNEATSGGYAKTRGITLKRNEPKPTVMPNAATMTSSTTSSGIADDVCMAGRHSVAVNIRFHSNSSQVNQKDIAFMKQIADAMNSPQLVNCYFVVEGHTDSVGEEQYNLWLSQSRAAKVKTQLARYNVDSNRMIVVGKGESELINAENPHAAENRRVQFKVINPSK